MKKHLKSLAVAAATAAFCFLLSGACSLTAKAEPTTLSTKYVGGAWQIQYGSTFIDGSTAITTIDRVHDGDTLVIYPSGVPTPPLDLSGVALENLTIYQNVTAVVSTKSVKDCYVLAGTTCSISGEIENAYLYDHTTCTFLNSVKNMTVYCKPTRTFNISVGSTVGHFKVENLDDNSIMYDFYEVASGALVFQNGSNQTPYNKYKAAPSATEAPTASAPSKNDSEYDSVPKTGESFGVYWMLLAAAGCLCGSMILRKKEV